MKRGLLIALLGTLMNLGVTGGLLYRTSDKFNSSAGLLEQKPLPVKLWSFRPTEVNALAEDLKKEREKLDAREADLGKFAAQVEAEKQEMEKVRTEIVTMREEISRHIPQVEQAEERNIKSLAKTYANVKPAAAVAIFREMDDNTVVKILSFMKAETVGAILTEMSKAQDKDETLAKRAALISDKLRLMEPAKKNGPQA